MERGQGQRQHQHRVPSSFLPSFFSASRKQEQVRNSESGAERVRSVGDGDDRPRGGKGGGGGEERNAERKNNHEKPASSLPFQRRGRINRGREEGGARRIFDIADASSNSNATDSSTTTTNKKKTFSTEIITKADRILHKDREKRAQKEGQSAKAIVVSVETCKVLELRQGKQETRGTLK